MTVPTLEDRIALLVHDSDVRVRLHGADPEHHATYVAALVKAQALMGSELSDVSLLLKEYRESRQRQRDGDALQPTYQRGLVGALAAYLSVAASAYRGRDIRVPPADARDVLQGQQADWDVEDPWHVIDRVISRKERTRV